MPKSNDSESTQAKQENVRLNKALAALQARLIVSNRRSDELSKQLTESLQGNKDLRDQLKDLQEKLDILIVQFQKRNRKDFGSTTERYNPQRAVEVGSRTRLPAKKKTKVLDIQISRKHIRNQKLPDEPVPCVSVLKMIP